MFGRTKRFARRSEAQVMRSVAHGSHRSGVLRAGSRRTSARGGVGAARSALTVAALAVVLGSFALAGSIAMTLDAGPSWSRGGFDVSAPTACTIADGGNVVDAAADNNSCPAPTLVGNGASGRPGTQWLNP